VRNGRALRDDEKEMIVALWEEDEEESEGE